MTAPLTKTFLRLNNVYFKPQTQAEAAYIQRRLFDMGIFWKTGETITALDECVAQGISVSKGRVIAYGRGDAPWLAERSAADFKNATPAEWQDLPTACGGYHTGLHQAQALSAPALDFARAGTSARLTPPAVPAPKTVEEQLAAIYELLVEVQTAQRRIEANVDTLLGVKAGTPSRPRNRRAP